MSFRSNKLLKAVVSDSSVNYIRVSSRPSRTNRDFASDSDINVIVSRFLKTGLLPTVSSVPQFADLTAIPRGTDALLAIRRAQASFERLPLSIRDALGHDMSKFESWLNDPANKDLALKYGFLKPVPQSKPGAGTPAAGAPVAQESAPKGQPEPKKGASGESQTIVP